MPSYPRYLILSDQSYFHITWQCHNKDWLLKQPIFKKKYYQLLLKYREQYGIHIYSYTFMDSHPHITGYCEDKKLLSDFMRRINTVVAKSINKYYHRRGQVIMDRFKSPRVQTDRHLLNIMAYIDLNPVRAKMVDHPKNYPWNSYAYYAYGKQDPLITPAPSYLALGSTPKSRQRAYRNLVNHLLKTKPDKKHLAYLNYIGDPEWVTYKTKALSQTMRQKRQQRQCPPPDDTS